LTPGSFDQGLFLAHLNKGREAFDRNDLTDAERELQEAYLLRPRDEKALNLLGLVFFKQAKLERAEEVYAKLAADNPQAATLHFNLGLIHYKLNRFEEAESDFLKASSLGPENPKLNFYLGSIYEKQHRFQDAIYQYRRAGASMMVRRVEGKIAGADTAPGLESRPSLAPSPGTQPILATQPVPRMDDAELFPASSSGPGTAQVVTIPAASEDQEDATAEAREIATFEATLPGHDMGPVTGAVLAHGPFLPTPAPAALGDAPVHRPREVPVSLPDIVSYTPGPRPLIDPDASLDGGFRFLERHLMEIAVSGKVFIKQGSLFSYTGNTTFWVKESRAQSVNTMVIVTGEGRLMLADRGRELAFLRVENQTLWVEPDHLLACDGALAPRYVVITEASPKVAFVVLEGSGALALSLGSRPFAMAVTPGLPVVVPSASVILWAGDLTPQILSDPALLETMAPTLGDAQRLLRLEGIGTVLAEQVLR
jgi:uncharacterized protein (AIM24 family)